MMLGRRIARTWIDVPEDRAVKIMPMRVAP